MKAGSVRSNAQRHLDAALSFVPATKTLALTSPSELFLTPLDPVGWPKSSAEWLDTPATHCSPLDDY
jgi:hypothetical protein